MPRIVSTQPQGCISPTCCARGTNTGSSILQMQTPTTKPVQLSHIYYENKESQEKVKAGKNFQTGESTSTG